MVMLSSVLQGSVFYIFHDFAGEDEDEDGLDDDLDDEENEVDENDDEDNDDDDDDEDDDEDDEDADDETGLEYLQRDNLQVRDNNYTLKLSFPTP